jgi:Domain of unknown function (DUF5668)
MMARRDLDPASLISGMVIAVFGVVLLLDRVDVIDLRFDYLWPATFAVIGATLLALGLNQRGRD